MKRIFYKAILVWIVVGGLFVGVFRGQEVRQKWVSRMKNRHDEKLDHLSEPLKSNRESVEVNLDEIEMATYHS